MTEILIDTDKAEEIARELIADGESVRCTISDLHQAIKSVVADEECQASLLGVLSEATSRSERVAEAWEELGHRLRRVAERFSAADYAEVVSLLGLGAWKSTYFGEHHAEPTDRDYLAHLALLVFTGSSRPAWTDDDLALFLSAARQASVAGRQQALQAIIDDPRLLAGLDPSLATLCVAALLEGALVWPGPSGPDSQFDYQILSGYYEIDEKGERTDVYVVTNDFAHWIRAGYGSEEEARAHMPDPLVGRMNCWEFVYYSAFVSGQVEYTELRDLHAAATKAAQQASQDSLSPLDAYYAVLGEAFQVYSADEWDAGTAPPAGSLVFFDDLSHVTISVGTINESQEAEIMSLWILPTQYGRPARNVQRTTIQAARNEYAKLYRHRMRVTHGQSPLGQPETGSSDGE